MYYLSNKKIFKFYNEIYWVEYFLDFFANSIEYFNDIIGNGKERRNLRIKYVRNGIIILIFNEIASFYEF
jgi:hypothetical protein